MIAVQDSPILRQGFHSKREAKEYAQLFLSDMCFWECDFMIDEERRNPSPKSDQTTSNALSRQSRHEGRNIGSQKWLSSDDSSSEGDDTSPARKMTTEQDLRWQAATDPATGKTYFYDTVTRKTQWEKPAEIRSWERQQKRERRKKDVVFFRDMEANIRASLARNQLIPGVPMSETKAYCLPSEEESNKSHDNKQNKKRTVRTISGMDERVLACLSQNTPSPASSPSPDALPASDGLSPENRNPVVYNTEGRPPLPSNMFSEVSNSRDKKKNGSGGRPLEEGRDPTSLKKTRLNDSLNTSKTSPIERPAPVSSHTRRNTGGTLFVQSTMLNPNVQATIKCVCGVFRAHIVQAQQQSKSWRSVVTVNGAVIHLDLFRDDYELPQRRNTQILTPSVEEIFEFYSEYFRRSQMEHDTIIMSLIYLERIIKKTNGRLSPTPQNWRSLLFSCMILSSKVWDDLSMWNVDFSNVSMATGIAPFSLKRINDLEVGVLTSLAFDVRVPASEYAKYYFLVRTMLIRSGLLESAAAPLSTEEAKTLEKRCNHYQSARLQKKGQAARRRTRSVDFREWFGGGGCDSSSPSNENYEPVLKDKVCLEQLVPMEQPHH